MKIMGKTGPGGRYPGVVLLSAGLFLLSYSDLRPSEGTRLFIGEIKAESGVSIALAREIRNLITLKIFSKLSHRYHVITDEDVQMMSKKAAQLQRQGNSAEIRMAQIAAAIDADEIIYGSLQRKGPRLLLVVQNVERNRKTLHMRKKSYLSLAFFESAMEHFAAEAAQKLINPRYRMNRSAPARFRDRVILKTIKLNKVQGLDISIMKFRSNDRMVSQILGILKGQVERGDREYKKARAVAARREYRGVLKRINDKLRPDRRLKLKTFIAGVKKRITATYVQEYRMRIEVVDKRLKKLNGSR